MSAARGRPTLPFPSPRLGGREAARIWPLAAVGWLMSNVSLFPVWMLIVAATGPLDQLPMSDPTTTADGWLIAAEGLAELARPLLWAAGGGLVLSWLWGVVWRGSVVGWRLWAGDRRPGLGELLGHGLMRFGRFLRLSLTSGLALAVGLVVVWAPAVVVLLTTGEPPPMTRLWGVLLIGGLGGSAVSVAVTLATLRGAWLLGRADRRSAVAAWLRGFDGTMQQPTASLATLVIWWLPAVLAAVVPLVLGWLVPSPGGTVAMVVLLQLSLLVRWGCRIALLASFAPTAGLPLTGG